MLPGAAVGDAMGGQARSGALSPERGLRASFRHPRVGGICRRPGGVCWSQEGAGGHAVIGERMFRADRRGTSSSDQVRTDAVTNRCGLRGRDQFCRNSGSRSGLRILKTLLSLIIYVILSSRSLTC